MSICAGNVQVMGKRSSQGSRRTSCVFRGGIALAVAYALAIQAMLFGLLGAQFASHPYDNASAGVELCLTGAHDGSGAPNAPAGPHHLNHCVLCFAGAQHLAMGGGSPSHADYDNNTHGRALAIEAHAPPFSGFAYSIARPRGPPVSA
jgi:hypothetical protein